MNSKKSKLQLSSIFTTLVFALIISSLLVLLWNINNTRNVVVSFFDPDSKQSSIPNNLNMPLNLFTKSDRLTSIPELNVSSPYPAPEITGISEWINSNSLTIEGLKGKVILVDFWTYSCINCQRTTPYVKQWYEKYQNQGLVVLGLHAPEFAYEQKKSNVEKAVRDNYISYPVGLDNSFATWGAYKNQFWPAFYLVDKDGNVRRTHFGEGEYQETEKAIQFLLEEK